MVVAQHVVRRAEAKEAARGGVQAPPVATTVAFGLGIVVVVVLTQKRVASQVRGDCEVERFSTERKEQSEPSARRAALTRQLLPPPRALPR